MGTGTTAKAPDVSVETACAAGVVGVVPMDLVGEESIAVLGVDGSLSSLRLNEDPIDLRLIDEPIDFRLMDDPMDDKVCPSRSFLRLLCLINFFLSAMLWVAVILMPSEVVRTILLCQWAIDLRARQLSW